MCQLKQFREWKKASADDKEINYMCYINCSEWKKKEAKRKIIMCKLY